MAFCSRGVSCTWGPCLPSSCQGTLWLLGYGPDAGGHAPSRQPGACTAGRTPRGACEAARGGPGRRGHPRAQAEGHPFHARAPSLCASAACQALASGRHRLGPLRGERESSGPLRRGRPGRRGPRSYRSVGFTPGGVSPSCYAASGCWPPDCGMRSWASPSSRPVSCAPRGFFPRTPWGLSSVRSSFPPLRYLRPGRGPLSCY
ncbi:keratin-associated protein 24-1 [Pteronotus mesoamericanus]|uniref:keratin-associated protein 24-1 n=1 Tax=Pteronotus mesoamericanus TaxID=1884717 RepID=UPI0023ECEBE8|nr:keratin-associated protein 24-1 [Pteronotus parnellii mesoamericanus]